MSSNPPDLSSFVQDQTTGLFLPPLAQRQIIPWDDMQVLNPSQQLPQISPDVITALSILAAQGPLKSLLLRTDAMGRLLASSVVQPIARLVAVANPGITTFMVDDTSAFYPGQGVTLQSATIATLNCVQVIVGSVPDQHTLIMRGVCAGQTYQIGDYVVGQPQVQVSNAPFIQGDVLQPFPAGAIALDGVLSLVADPVGRNQLRTDATRALDLFLWSGNITNAIASVQFSAPGAGKRLQLAFLRASTYDSTSAIHDDVEVWKNGLGTGTQLDGWHLLTNAASAIDRLPAVTYPLVGDVNGTLGARVIRVGAGTTHAVAMGAFILQT